MNEMPRIEEHMSREIAAEMARLNRQSGNPNVDRPSHYVASNGMEVLDFIEAFALGFHEGTIVQYVVRWPKKNGLEDLYKARAVLDRLILLKEGERA